MTRITQLFMFFGLMLFSFFAIGENSSVEDCKKYEDIGHYIRCVQGINNINDLIPPPPSSLSVDQSLEEHKLLGEHQPLMVPAGADLNLNIK